MKIPHVFRVLPLLLGAGLGSLSAQVEVAPWANITGLRVDGQPHSFETRFAVVEADGRVVAQTAHHQVTPVFRREAGVVTTLTKLPGFTVEQTVRDAGPGRAELELRTKAEPGASQRLVLVLRVPRNEFSPMSLSLEGGPAQAHLPTGEQKKVSRQQLSSPTRSLAWTSDLPLISEWVEPVDARQTYLECRLTLPTGAANEKPLRIGLQVAGQVDVQPATVAVDVRNLGSAWDGIGGNFRIQFPDTDPVIIDYNLKNLPIVSARTCLWWQDWDAEESSDPLVTARARGVSPRIARQIALDVELARRGLPLIVSTWDPPAWAISTGPRRPGTYGDPLLPSKWRRAAQSIASYLVYLKQEHGIEAQMFSFNEPDIGVQMPQTPEEHVAMIKLLGEEFTARGLATRLLLADTSNATPYSLQFVEAALRDPVSLRYVAAIGFHTWGACENENLALWAKAARRAQRPLLVTEGGPDSEAHRNPHLFRTPWYQLEEADLYVRLAGVAGVNGIQPWQLTADYSLLSGGGAYGETGPLTPTQRFWNLKQLGLTVRGSFQAPTTSSRTDLSTAAFFDPKTQAFSLHLVNNGAKRTVSLTGLPATLRQLRLLVTDATRGAAELGTVPVEGGRAVLELPSAALVSAVSVSAP